MGHLEEITKHRIEAINDYKIAKTGANIQNQFNKNVPVYQRRFDTHENDFCDGTYRDIIESYYDRELFDAEVQRVQSSGIVDKLQTAISSGTRRKRVLSEHDGEWDMDRNWDHEPFHAVKKMPDKRKAIEFVWHMQFSANVNGPAITKCGALMYAICELISRTGTMIKIVGRFHTTDINAGNGLDLIQNIVLKDYDEYISGSELAAGFTSNFFRRVMFTQIILSSDRRGQEVDRGLGQVPRQNHGLKYSEGKLEAEGVGWSDGEVSSLIDKIIQDLGLG